MSEAILRNALEHIAKVAAMARNPTRRLDFIEARAKTALEGHAWSEDFMPPAKVDPLRRLVKQLLIRTQYKPQMRADIIRWLTDGAIPDLTPADNQPTAAKE